MLSNEFNTEFAEEVRKRPGGENISVCYACGTCTAGCPVSSVRGEYNPRKIIRQVLLGLRAEVLSSKELWLCTQCHACVAHCPQDVRFADIIRVLRELAVEGGYITREKAAELSGFEDVLKRERVDKILDKLSDKKRTN
jgi:heterodisulfide reductase subunit C